jgi:OmpA-OmpF porin, OOP family
MKTILIPIVLTVILFNLQIVSATAQINFKKITKNALNNRSNKDANQAVNKGLDQVEGIFKNKDGSNKDANKPAGDKTKTETANNGTSLGSQDQSGLQSYSKYDFVAGEKVIYYEDFGQDAIGDFPALWNTNGSAEVVTTSLFPGNWMRFVTKQCVWTDLLLDLPDNYTIEFEVIPIGGLEGSLANMSGWNLELMQARNVKAWDSGSAPGKGGYMFTIEYYGTPRYHTWLYGTECEQLKTDGYVDREEYKEKINQKYHIAIWVQKSRVRLYQDQNKVFDTPKAFPEGCVKPDRMRFGYGAAMISNIHIAVGAPDIRNKLMTDGKLVTYGIYFDVNKDVVKPESYGTLKEIAKILNEVPDVKVKIVGHTDSDGADAANLDLSKRRSTSVKAELAKSFSVNADRLVTDGMGESQPVAPNDTPVNKALNRRVEFIKL